MRGQVYCLRDNCEPPALSEWQAERSQSLVPLRASISASVSPQAVYLAISTLIKYNNTATEKNIAKKRQIR